MMNYTIPYNDHIHLPKISEIIKIEATVKDMRVVSGEVSGLIEICGEYLMSTGGTFEFNHPLPFSIFTEEENVRASIDISRFEYEMIPNHGVEIMVEAVIEKHGGNEAEPDDVDTALTEEVIEAKELTEVIKDGGNTGDLSEEMVEVNDEQSDEKHLYDKLNDQFEQVIDESRLEMDGEVFDDEELGELEAVEEMKEVEEVIVVETLDEPVCDEKQDDNIQIIAKTEDFTVSNILGRNLQECYVTYKVITVQSNDTMDTLADKYGDCVNVAICDNDNRDTFNEGEKLIIPISR